MSTMSTKPQPPKLQPDGTPQPAPGQQTGTGDTRVSTGNTPKPRLPHERDQSSDSQADNTPVDDGRARQAHDDIERGVVDTDKGPVIDQAYDRVKNSPST